jgi:hypothetical protein
MNLNEPSNVSVLEAMASSADYEVVLSAVHVAQSYVESRTAYYEVYHSYIDALAALVQGHDYKPSKAEQAAAEVAYEEVVIHLGLMMGDIV